MNLLHIKAIVLLIGYTLALESDADQEIALNRYRRSWKKQKQAVPKCPAGTRAVVTCEPCPIGYYTQNNGFWESCVACPEGKTTTPEKRNKCVLECSPGWTWNGKKCTKCADGTVKPDPGNHACEPCTGYWKPNAQQTECDVLECPAGYEPGFTPNGEETCRPCNFGFYKKFAGGLGDFCEKCRKDQWTLSTASTLMSDCIKRFPDETCEAGYPEMVAIMQVAYQMTENDTSFGEFLCEDPGVTVDDIRSAQTQIRNCLVVEDPVSGQEMVPVYRDETKEIELATLASTMPSCLLDESRDCEDFWQQRSSYYFSSFYSSGSFSWSSGSSMWSSGGGFSGFFGRPQWFPMSSGWSSGWSSGSWSSGSWSSGSWSSGSWSNLAPWWTSCLSDGVIGIPNLPSRPEHRPFPGMGSGGGNSFFPLPPFSGFNPIWHRGGWSEPGETPGSGWSGFGFGPMSGSGIDPRFKRLGRIGDIVRGSGSGNK